MHEKTTFLVSHRLSTILRAHQVLVLENGSIAERGTHDELLAKDAVYARLYRHQVRGLLAQSDDGEARDDGPLRLGGDVGGPR